MKTHQLSLTRSIQAPVGSVFDAWLEPEVLARFMTPGEGMSCPRVNVEPKVGGSFTIVMKVGDTELPHTGVYKAIERAERLSFTWHSNNAPNGSLVTLSFRELGPKETELTLTHEGLPTEKSRDDHNGGWGRILRVLSELNLASVAA